MPGRNHDVEAGFLDSLPNSLRDASADLLHFYRLKQLVEMRQNGVPPSVEKRFDLKKDQWEEALDAVILTKVSYFEVSTQMSPRHINRLLEIAAYALNMPGAGLGSIYEKVEKDYTFFADWLKKIHVVRKTLVKQAKSQGMINS